jgi:Tol biopolymer transport system component
MIRKICYLLIGCLLGQPVSADWNGGVFYSGLADNGWQVYYWDCAMGKEFQITKSPGDKRMPVWVPSMKKVVYKDSIGQICVVDRSGREQTLVKGVRTCAHFTVTQDGNDIYYTRLLANNPLRQSLWHVSSDDGFSKPELIFRMPRGSIRNVCINPSGETIAISHVWRDNEERILLLDLGALKTDPTTTAKPITPELITAAFPSYGKRGEVIYFSMRVSRGNYDLFSFSLASKKTKPLFATSSVSEFYPVATSDGRWIFYEIRENAGNAIAVYDIQNKTHRMLKLPRPAKEPCYIDQK